MSISFWVPDAPRVEVKRDCYACDGVGSVFWETADGEETTAVCEYCGGTGKQLEHESTLPEVNMSNRNALDFLAALGEEPDYCGEWSVAQLDRIAGKLMYLANGVGAQGLELSTVQEGNFISCGRDQEYVTRRANDLHAVVVAARRAGWPVVWG